jgi:CHASE1-domain containing sensor protein
MLGTQVQKVSVTLPEAEPEDDEDEDDPAGVEDEGDDEQPAATSAASAAAAIAAARARRLLILGELVGAAWPWGMSFMAPPGRGVVGGYQGTAGS